MVFLTIFEYAESNSKRCQAQLFMQRLEFYDSKSRKSLENLSKTKVSASCEPVQDIYMLLYMWPTVWGVLKIILQCFELFLSMLKLIPGGAKINYLCEGSNFTNKNLHNHSTNHSTRTLMKGPIRILIQYTAHIYACSIYFKLFSSILIKVPSGAKLKYLCKNSYFAI